jgi:hypothetical protein
MRYKRPVFVVALCVLGPLLAEATVVLPLDFRQLTGKATAIARGRVVALTPQWAINGRGIETIVTVQVANYLKGDFGPQMTFRVPGGKMGRFRAVTVGAPVFREGEEVIVFLGADGPAIPHIVGFNQGVYRVAVDRASGVRVVTPPLLSSDVTAPTPIVRGDPSRRPMPLQQFEARVRSMLQPDRVDRGSRGSGIRNINKRPR